MIKRTLFILVLIFSLFSKGFTQDYTSTKLEIIDSLKNVIYTAKQDTVKISTYLSWGEQIYMQQPDSAIIFWQKAEQIAKKLLTTKQPTHVIDITKKYLSEALNNIGYIYKNQGNVDKALEYNNKSLNIKENIGDKEGMATSFNNMGIIYFTQGNIAKALEYYHKSLKILEEIGNKQGMAYSLNNIGGIYSTQGDIPKALEYYNKSLNIKEELGDKKGMAYSFNNIGAIYESQGDTLKSLEYYHKSLNLRKEISDKKGMADSFNNIGAIYDNQNNIPKALEYYHKSLKIREEMGYKQGMATSFNNIGAIYNKQDNIIKAIEYYHKSLDIREEIGDKKGLATSLYILGRVNQKNNDIKQFQIYANRSYSLSKELQFPWEIEGAASLMKDLSVMQGDYKKAFEYYQEEIEMQDSIQNEKNYKQTQKQQARYEYQKQAAIDSIAHAKSIEIKDIDLARQKAEGEKQKAIIGFVIGGLLLVILFFAFLYRLFVQKKKANKILVSQKEEIEEKNEELNQQNEEISAQRDEIEAQRDRVIEQKEHIEEQKEEIEDSILYAKRIQNAVLPNLNQFLKSFKTFQKLDDKEDLSGLKSSFDHFIIFKPHSLVSGDFYWATRTENWLIITVADCTGHGVPGAFMSMLGISFLNEIVRKNEVTNVAEILNQLRLSIIEALKQTGEEGTQKDGMDMSIIAINLSNCSELPCEESQFTSQGISPDGRNDKVYKAQWAGANNPLYIVKSLLSYKVESGEKTESKSEKAELDELSTLQLNEIKGDKMPVAIYLKMDNFTNHEIEIDKGDKLYLFTDGFPDQFGGPKAKKFKYKEFKQLLIETSDLSMKEQGFQMEKVFDDWVNYEGNVYEQIDDVTVLGIEI